MKIKSTQRETSQLSQGQGEIWTHNFYSSDVLIGTLVTEQWMPEGFLLLHEIKVTTKRQKYGTDIIKWVISQNPSLKIKPVHLTTNGYFFWRHISKLYPDNLYHDDIRVSDYLNECDKRSKFT